MAIWAISDLHLSFGVKDKPMNVFGQNWDGYEEKVKNNWCNKISESDTVILAGDFSWGMYLSETVEDFKFLHDLPGKKIMIKGNHDYWWETLSKMNKFKKENGFLDIDFIHNNFFDIEGIAFCGTRGWEIGSEDLTPEQDLKASEREKERLVRSLELAKDYDKIIVVTHYNVGTDDSYIEILKRYNVKKCIYGHLHGRLDKEKLNYVREGIEFICTSCDTIDFDPMKIEI